ncbi:tRNA(Ile)(2)-agmatinylcytidine synthase [Natranaeroarchaeum aerophilus]|uniref:tRNA(Ile2) 2-agmatinylcytidine synthetase TiaS n=1 Tax=Natranaeroarchaeum aerophilus TaxID=2917711 RepID=A0AAE3K6B7_9EURY|nr:tRNA(Ile)(2)-agmatinylcytidine synthase [Natranaeroarchaeum aerophilus]MCL9814828.1 tRNA(Ile)(2)-agmatinylcytidine synthase [Natranaeroarchaeum aerophilus]
MTVIGLDDTDSREQGMCTTYAASRIADEISAAGSAVTRVLLIRLNPAVEHKTRGNAALAIHTDLTPDRAFGIAREFVADSAVTDDPRTSPGVVVASGSPEAVPDDVAAFAGDATSRHHDLADARALIDAHGYRSAGWDGGRGRIGALAAIGAWRAHDDWTYEYISYREDERRGTPRDIDLDTVFAAADDYYPEAWDTVDRVEGQAVCVPHTPGPILHGIRGDNADVVRTLAQRIESEPVESARLFHTNQGTDSHLIDGEPGDIEDGHAYRVDGTVVDPPETREGGHVFLTVEDGDASRQCAAFEPTKRFRDRVRTLRVGDRVTVCGEVSDGTLKLEKFAVRTLDETELVTPTCPDCERRMESAGAGQGYRCRDCKTSSDGKVERRIERDLEPGWYEVPPCARRHIAKPLVRGGFDAPTHPER